MLIQNYTFQAFSGPSFPSSSARDDGSGIIAVIHIIGHLSRDSWWNGVPALQLIEALSALQDSERVSGIILDWNSPGGEASAVPPMLDFLSRRRKKIVSSVELAASAAYWIAAATDGVYLQNDITAAVGSIGVMTTFQDWSEFYKKNGITIREIYAPQSKDKNGPWRKAQQGDDSAIESELEYLAGRFIENIRQLRPHLDPQATSGAMYFAPDALKMGLADEIIPLHSLIDRMQAAADIENTL